MPPSTSQLPSSRWTASGSSVAAAAVTSPTSALITSVRVTMPWMSPYSSTMRASSARFFLSCSSRSIALTDSGTYTIGFDRLFDVDGVQRIGLRIAWRTGRAR
jgi:hypothetical protein